MEAKKFMLQKFMCFVCPLLIVAEEEPDLDETTEGEGEHGLEGREQAANEVEVWDEGPS